MPYLLNQGGITRIVVRHPRNGKAKFSFGVTAHILSILECVVSNTPRFPDLPRVHLSIFTKE